MDLFIYSQCLYQYNITVHWTMLHRLHLVGRPSVAPRSPRTSFAPPMPGAASWPEGPGGPWA